MDPKDSPLPADLDSAIKEILSLRRRLHQANQKWAGAVEKSAQVARSASGQARKAAEETRRLRDALAGLKVRGTDEPECFCQRPFDDPERDGEHADYCAQARHALRAP